MDQHNCQPELSDIEKTILNHIGCSDHTSKSTIEKIFNIKHATLSRAVDGLVEKGLLVYLSKGESHGGRKPKMLSINPDAFYLAGIDLSRTYIRVILTNACLDIMGFQEYKIPGNIESEEEIKIAGNLMSKLLENSPVDISKLAGIGIGTVGLINKQKGVWNDIPIVDILERKFNVNVVLENGANAATFAEYKVGSGKNCKDILFVNIGIGVRCGLICNGKIMSNINTYDTAFSHIVIEADGRKCTCGNYGCLKAYTTIKPIIDEYTRKYKVIKPASPCIDIENIRISDINEYAAKGDQAAIEVLTDAASYMGIGLANIVNTINPEIVILGGPLIENGQFYFEKTIESARSRIYKASERSIKFVKSFYEKESISLGVCAIMSDYYFNGILKRQNIL